MAGELLDQLFSFQPDDADLKPNLVYHSRARQFVNQISNVPAQKFVKDADTEQDPLELLDPSFNTIAYIFALQSRIVVAGDSPQTPRQIPEPHKPGGAIWNKMTRFLETADPVQLRYVGTEWRRLVDYIETVARVVGAPTLAIAPIRSALLRLDPTSGTFTNTHLHFLRLCMETRAYASGVQILDNYIYSLPSKIPYAVASLEYSVPAAEHTNSGDYITQKSAHTDKITLQALQEYYVLGAMAYSGVRQFKDARDFLEHVLVMPSTNGACTGLFVEAYQKWVLLSLLVDGYATHEKLPRTASNTAIMTAKSASKAYDILAEAFVDLNNMTKLKAQIKEGRDKWAEDGNGGLVQELIESQLSFAIKRLSRTYSAIPVSNVATNLGADVNELTPYLARLIEERRLNAELSDTGKADVGIVLRFFLVPTQGPLAKSEKQQQRALLEQTQRTSRLMEQVKSANSRLRLTKEHVDHIKHRNKKTVSSNESMDTSWDVDSGLLEDFDEDVMGDAH